MNPHLHIALHLILQGDPNATVHLLININVRLYEAPLVAPVYLTDLLLVN